MFIKVGQIYSLYIHIGIDLESNQQVQMQYIHTNIHIFIKYSSIIFHTTVLYFYFFFSLFEAKFMRNFKQATLKTVQTKKTLCISCEFLSRSQAYSIYNIQISMLEK